MSKPNITTEQANRLLAILQKANCTIVAADLAARLRLAGTRETQRRHVRAIIKHLRDNGNWVVATLQGGYFLTTDRRLWNDYNEGRQIDAKRVLAITHKRERTLFNSAGQGVLFGPVVMTGIG